ncbi:sigma-54-dependent transcriptional regulator [Schlesneria paludicola]|uniref:sigma-54-dependent transcriptional regulator n=1 Tax=Schlesneria paludicola TaxID=360056 RepID=UPI00029A15B6|nr:sigma-54 dependent transcriptional regulator [Schlesneria paludicola]
MTDERINRILLADDEPLYLQTTAELLRRAGFECLTAVDAEGALSQLSTRQIDLMIVDLNMPGNLDLELLKIGRRDYPDVPMIVVTGAPSLHSAIDSVKLRISDYLLKPVKFEDLVASVRHSLSHDRTTKDPALANNPTLLLGESPQIREIHDLIRRVAMTDVSVLITGESGTGKELAAQSLHRSSRRHQARFATIDCTAIPESLFESVLFGHTKGSFTGATNDQPGLLKEADGGTIFLDEIGELPLSLQAKLLRVIQHSTFTPVGQTRPMTIDVRFIAATNRDLEEEVRRERFRRDLFYRLAVVPISLPPLRDRGGDVMLLANHFLRQLSLGNQPNYSEFSLEAAQSLQTYSWPGNVRELRNVVERAVVLSSGRVIEQSDLPSGLAQADSAGTPFELGEGASARGRVLSQADRSYIEELLRVSGGNVSRAAATAGLTRQGLYKLLQKHGLPPARFRTQ